MNISGPFIKRPVMTTLVMAAILFFGSLSFIFLPISDLPSIAWPTILVSAVNPGADAATMASTIATPLEKQIMTISGLNSVISQSVSGNTNINLTFDLNKTLDSAATDTAAALNRAQGQLPTEMPQPPSYKKYNPSATPIIYIAISSETMTLPELYDYADAAVAQRISMVEGVSQVLIYGSKRAIRVKLDPDLLASRGLGLNEVADSIRNMNQLLPAGTVYDPYSSYTLEPKGQLFSGREYEPQIIAYRNGGPVRIRDVGHAEDGTEEENISIRFWNDQMGEKPTIVLGVDKLEGFNTVKIASTIENMYPMLKETIPSSIDIHTIYNQAGGIKSSINDVEFTLVLAFALVVLVIFLFLGNLSSTTIPSVALPMAIIGTFMMMYLLGYSIDILSMLGLTLVIGFLVDDAIVVLENIVRHMEMGKSPMEAALDGSKQISTTVLSMTLSLSAVFIPLVFMPGIIGRMFHEFAMVVVIAVLFSGAISLTLTPMLCSKFLRAHREETRLEKIAHTIMNRLLKLYVPMLEWVLRHRWVPIGGAAAALAISLFLFQTIAQDFIPAGDTGAIQGLTVASQGISPDAISEEMKKLSEIVRKSPYVESVVTGANMGSMAPPNQGLFFVMLKPLSKRPAIGTVIKEMYGEMASLSNMHIFMRAFPEINLDVGTSAARADYSYYLSTIGDPEDLYLSTEKLTAELQKIPELTHVSSNVQNKNPQLEIEILRDQARNFGISTENIENAFSLAYAGGQLAQYSTDIDTYRIIVEMENRFRNDPNSLKKIYLAPSNIDAGSHIFNANVNNVSNTFTTNDVLAVNNLVPLQSVANWKTTVGPLTVNHLDQFTAATIFFDLADGAALGTALQKVEQAAEKTLPLNITRTFKGTAEVFKGTIASIVILLIIGILAIYLLLGILYESFIHPITILSALPGALFGALVTLLLADSTLSLYAYIGIIVLIGIVMKNGIMLVEFANQSIDEGLPAYDAIVEACKVRFRPILMRPLLLRWGRSPLPLALVLKGRLADLWASSSWAASSSLSSSPTSSPLLSTSPSSRCRSGLDSDVRQSSARDLSYVFDDSLSRWIEMKTPSLHKNLYKSFLPFLLILHWLMDFESPF